MTHEISPKLFDHLVELAALELTPDEAKYLRRELNNQIVSIRALEAIPLDDETQPAAHGVPYTPKITPAIREDEHIPCENVAAILAQVPEMNDGYIVVPEIPHEELG